MKHIIAVYQSVCPWWPSGYQVWHLITGSHLCVGLTPTMTMLKTCPSVALGVMKEM